MIKAEDLRIGDLVRVRKMKFCRFIIPEDVAYKVTQIISKDLLINNRSSVCLCLTNPKQNQTEYPMSCWSLLPIPLTPEILEKNGWSKRHDGSSSCDIYSKGKGSFHVRLEQCIYKKQEGFDFAVGDSTYRFGNKIEHVHELQHILWALDLDANLKI